MTPTRDREDLDDLKSRVDLLELFRTAGLDPKKRGKNWFCRCPFHEDTEASLSIDPAKRLWNCFSCEAGGDALAFLQRKENLEFLPALQRLRDLAGTLPATAEPPPSQNTLAYQRNDLLERVIEHYQDCFKRTPAAQQYCNQRGLDSRELWDAFRVGFCDGSLAQKLPAEGGVREALQHLGVLNEHGKEAFRGCLVVPLSHPDLGWVGLYGRRLNDQAQVKHQYLPGPHQGVLNWQALQTSATMVVAESVLDALSLWRAGHSAVTCIFGVQGVPEHFASLLKNYSVRQVTLVMDGDRAGQKATQRLSTMFLEAGLECSAVDLPEDTDPNRLLQERGPDGLLQVLKNRREIAGEAPAEPTTFQDGDQSFTATFGNTKYQLWPQAPFTTRLRARLRASRDHRMVMDVVDFYVGRSRKGILNQLIAQLELSRVDGERHLLLLMEHLERWVASRREEEQGETSELPAAPELSAAQKEEALHYLKQPRLVQRILNDMEELGYVGEENSKLLGYLISVSRKLEKPLSGVVLSQSGAGKSSLTELVEVMTPPEEVILFSRISPQALYWMPRDGVKRKLLILEERVGGEGADYSIRVLQSRQKLIQAVVIKDPATGKLMTKTFVVEGPIAYLETTTDLRINHENATRCFEIVLDESAEQTKRIHGWQRAQRLPSRQDRRRVQEKLRELHHNAQRLLEPVLVYVPYADKLSFPSRWLRTRRDHERFLCLIEAAAFLHQYQRESGHTEDGSAYVLANLEDYELAYTLAKDVLRSTLHELSREAQELWEQLKEWAQEQGTEATFTRRDVRQLTSGEDYRLRQALGELVEMEYLEASNTGQGRTIHYRLQGGGDTRVPPSLRELTTPEELRSTLRL